MEKINECYYSKGYILSKIDSIYDDPDGVLNLSITEGKINKISISGDRGRSVDFIGKSLIQLAPKKEFWRIWKDNIGKIPEEDYCMSPSPETIYKCNQLYLAELCYLIYEKDIGATNEIE